jgi:hypothetical protein
MFAMAHSQQISLSGHPECPQMKTAKKLGVRAFMETLLRAAFSHGYISF